MIGLKESAASKILRIILYIIFAAGIVLTVTMPFMIDRYMRILYDAYAVDTGYKTFITVFLMAVGVLGLFIVWELIIMMRTLMKNPFVRGNVKSLNIIGATAFIIAAIFFVKCFVYVTIMTLLAGICLVILGLFAFTLANLFNKAIEYKEENDLTI
ncbi:MAG: DUF2975 domain-containing protein [Oscillospiraceae bacterium]|nr:DUF2975 domain-containing protein [Oscillospiraceae bacterium]